MPTKIYIAMALFVLSNISYAASFDCAKASSPFEKAICANPTLSSLDDQLANVYKKAKENSVNGDQLKNEQLLWIKSARACSTDVGCIEQAYKTRISALTPPSPPTKPSIATQPQPAFAASTAPTMSTTPSQSANPTKKSAPIQLINTSSPTATVGSCYAVISFASTISPEAAGGMSNWQRIIAQAKTAKPSFENVRNPAPAGTSPRAWSDGWQSTNQIIGDASDQDKLKAFNVCMSIYR